MEHDGLGTLRRHRGGGGYNGLVCAAYLGRAGLRTVVLERRELEWRFGLIGGSIFHGEMALAKLISLRPAPGLAGYRTPLSGLYMCGAGTHPGGGVMGIPGFDA